MIPIKLPLLFAAAIPLQLAFLGAHLALSVYFPQKRFEREALPLIYLAGTYAQWLLFSFFISWRTKKYRVPIIMHLPHLLSFLPLIRHVMIAADRIETEPTGLLLAWVHSVATHIFSLVAAWLWQMRRAFEEDLTEKHDLIPIAIYALMAFTTILIYGGLDMSFAAVNVPLAVGLIQLLLNVAVTGLLLLRETSRITALTLIPAVIFSLVNGSLLFDRARAEMGVELALAGSSFTQIFTLYVFLHFSRHSKQA